MALERVCVVGAGAIGGWIGARLAAVEGVRKSALARGETLAALRQHGWRLSSDGSTVSAPVMASDRATDLGEQDMVVIAVKAQALPELAGVIGPLIGPETVILPAMNGVPWWFGEGLSALDGDPLDSVDPGGQIAAALPARQVIGCVVHAAVGTAEPGLAAHKMGNGLIVGEPEGEETARAREVFELLTRAGFDATLSENIRFDIWYKLWGNLTMNPVSAMTGAATGPILSDRMVRDFCSACMTEAAEIGARIGCPIDQSPEDRHQVTAKLGSFKTSMLQDAEAGKSLELDAIVAVVSEIGRRVGVPTPSINALLGLTRLFARSHGLYPPAED